MRPDGRGRVTLTPRDAEDAEPDWSPTAPRCIAFTRRYGYGPLGVYVANADGSGARMIIGDARNPKWSPNGRRIAYSALAPAGIHVMHADGTGSRLVRQGAHSDVSWSPNGRLLLFSAVNARGSATHAFVMNADGSGLRRVTTRCADDSYPAWSPDGRRIVIACIRTRPTRNYPDSTRSMSTARVCGGSRPTPRATTSQRGHPTVSGSLTLGIAASCRGYGSCAPTAPRVGVDLPTPTIQRQPGSHDVGEGVLNLRLPQRAGCHAGWLPRATLRVPRPSRLVTNTPSSRPPLTWS